MSKFIYDTSNLLSAAYFPVQSKHVTCLAHIKSLFPFYSLAFYAFIEYFNVFSTSCTSVFILFCIFMSSPLLYRCFSMFLFLECTLNIFHKIRIIFYVKFHPGKRQYTEIAHY